MTNTKDEIVRMKKSLSNKEFIIDTLLTNRKIIDKFRLSKMQIKLNENGSYFFKNAPASFKKFEGEWDLSDDTEISFFIFRLQNGDIQRKRSLCLQVEDFLICFKESSASQ
jgi:hypothetical protein